jgi:sigma-B regulation protein RsbU (phosphoserine phosphatase)
MNKVFQILAKLNIVRLASFIMAVSFLLLMNFFLIRSLYQKNSTYRLETQCSQFNAKLIEETDKIERIAAFVTSELNEKEGIELLSQKQRNYQLLYRYINNIEIKTNLQQGWHFTIDTNKNIAPYFVTQLDGQNQLCIKLDASWINSLFNKNNLDVTSNAFIYDQNLKFLWKKGETSDIHPFSVFLTPAFTERISSLSDAQLVNGFNHKQLGFSSQEKTHLFYVTKNPKFNWYIFYHHPHGVFNDYLTNYFKRLSYIILIFIGLISSLIVSSDRAHKKPMREVLKQLKNSSFIHLNPTSKDSEAAVVLKGIEMLNNQLDQYKSGLEKSKSHHKKLENDLLIAKKLQGNLRPKDNDEIANNPGFKIFAYSEAAFDIGGDFFEYFMLDKDHLLITIADVAGKGIPASLFMIYAQTLLKSIVQNYKTVSEIAENLNNRLIEEKVSDLFITMFFGIYDLKEATFTYCNAAHNFPLLIKEEGTIEELNETHGIAVGIYPNRKYKSTTISIELNDQLFLYTDGLIDSHDENNMTFSLDVIKYNLLGTWFLEPREVVEKLKNCIVSFRGNRPPEDDTTMMALKFTPAKSGTTNS